MTRVQELARLALPSMPKEVFSLWLDALISAHGWPPSGDLWSRALRKRRLPFLQALRWRKRAIDLSRAKLTAETKFAAERLSHAAFAGAKNEYSRLAKTASVRIEAIAAAARKEGCLPGEMIIFRMPDGTLEVVDGALRMAVAFSTMSSVSTGRRPTGVTRAIAWIGDTKIIHRPVPRIPAE